MRPAIAVPPLTRRLRPWSRPFYTHTAYGGDRTQPTACKQRAIDFYTVLSFGVLSRHHTFKGRVVLDIATYGGRANDQ